MSKKFLSLMLTLMMLFTCIPAGIFAEGEEEVVVEPIPVVDVTPAPVEDEQPEPAPAPAPADETPADEPAAPADEPAADEPAAPAEEPADEPEAVEDPETADEPEAVEEPAEEDEEPETADEQVADAFQSGLVTLTAGDVYTTDRLKKSAGTLNQNATVYAVERVQGEGEIDANDVIKVALNVEGEILVAYVKAARLTWLTEDQADAYAKEDHEDAVDYRGVKLDPVNFTAAVEEAAPAEATPNPVEETPEPEEEMPVQTAEAAALAATASPEVAYVTAAQTAQFTATADNAEGTVTYQWQYSADNGTTWKTLGGTSSKTDTLRINATDTYLGWQFRCLVTAENGSAATNAVHYVRPAVIATASPEVAELTATQQAVFTVTTEYATGTISYQWQYSADEGANWRTLGGTSSKTDTLTINAIDAYLTWQFRCLVTAENGSAASNAVHFVRPTGFIEDYGTYTITYTILENGNVSVTGYTGNADTITIPTNPRTGYTVTEIGEEAFMGNTSLVSITLPNTVTAIRARAFKGCVNLGTMNTH